MPPFRYDPANKLCGDDVRIPLTKMGRLNPSLMSIIVGFLEFDALKSLSVANREVYRIAGRRLWRSIIVSPVPGIHLQTRIDELANYLSRPERIRHLHNININLDDYAVSNAQNANSLYRLLHTLMFASRLSYLRFTASTDQHLIGQLFAQTSFPALSELETNLTSIHPFLVRHPSLSSLILSSNLIVPPSSSSLSFPHLRSLALNGEHECHLFTNVSPTLNSIALGFISLTSPTRLTTSFASLSPTNSLASITRLTIDLVPDEVNTAALYTHTIAALTALEYLNVTHAGWAFMRDDGARAEIFRVLTGSASAIQELVWGSMPPPVVMSGFYAALCASSAGMLDGGGGMDVDGMGGRRGMKRVAFGNWPAKVQSFTVFERTVEGDAFVQVVA